jgi:hypothetical protein
MFRAGLVKRVPKVNKDAKLFLALAASSLDPRSAYSEKEVNAQLMEWMEGFTCTVNLDHVTIRRCLVDHYFLLRDSSGEVYRTNQPIINDVIEPPARSIQPRYLFEEVEREKIERRREHAT